MNRYQLIAINNETGEEYIIPLNNGARNNKAPLGYIDNGVARFKCDDHLAKHLFDKGVIPTTNVTFKIKYRANKKDNYLSPIYDDITIRNVSKRANNDLNSNDVFIEHTFNDLLIKLSKPNFYDFLLVQNKNPQNNGDSLNDKIMGNIIKYLREMDPRNILKIDFNLENSFLRELTQYKQVRTLYKIIKDFDRSYIDYNENKEVIFDESKEEFKEIEIISVREDLYGKIWQLYQLGGMEAIYEIYDLDDIYEKDGVQLVLK